MIISESTEIQQAAELVFEYYLDFTRHHEFIALMESADFLTEPPLQVGSQVVEVCEMITGGMLKMRSEVTHFTPNERITCISIDGGNQIEQDFQVEKLDDASCLVKFTTRVIPPKSLFGMATRMAGSLMKSKVEEHLRNDLATFKQIVEAEDFEV